MRSLVALLVLWNVLLTAVLLFALNQIAYLLKQMILTAESEQRHLLHHLSRMKRAVPERSGDA